MSVITTTIKKCDICGKVCDPLRRVTSVVNWGYMNENPLRMEFEISMSYGRKDACKECVLENLKKVVQDMERKEKYEREKIDIV